MPTPFHEVLAHELKAAQERRDRLCKENGSVWPDPSPEGKEAAMTRAAAAAREYESLSPEANPGAQRAKA